MDSSNLKCQMLNSDIYSLSHCSSLPASDAIAPLCLLELLVLAAPPVSLPSDGIYIVSFPSIFDDLKWCLKN
uniref:Uncharacterized protein n=1 Tax=Oryza brachyantha TaxID=4533 RepID=J3MSK3_ORYBR